MMPCRMIVEPEQRVADFIKAGSDIVSVHAEQSATIHLHRLVNNVSLMLAARVLMTTATRSAVQGVCYPLSAPSCLSSSL